MMNESSKSQMKICDSLFCEVQNESRLNNGQKTLNFTEYKARSVVTSGKAGRTCKGTWRCGRVPAPQRRAGHMAACFILLSLVYRFQCCQILHTGESVKESQFWGRGTSLQKAPPYSLVMQVSNSMAAAQPFQVSRERKRKCQLPSELPFCRRVAKPAWY